MKYLELGNTTIPSNQITNVMIVNENVILIDSNGRNYGVFSGNKSACEEFKTSLLTLLELTEKVTLPEVHWIGINNKMSLPVGMAFVPTVKYDGMATQDFTLQSSQVTNAKISDKFILGLQQGTSDITITSNNKSDKMVLDIIQKPLNVNFDEQFRVYVKRETQIKLFDEYHKEINPYYINFINLNQDKLKIDNNGKVIGVATGEAIILAEYNKNYYVKNINVLPEPPKFQRENLTLKVDETNQQNVTDSTFSNQEWFSDKPEIASVTKNGGLITAKKVGKCKISCMFKTPYEVVVKEINVTVHPKAPVPDNQNQILKVGEIFRGSMPKKAGFSGVKWVSDNETLVTVDPNNGLATTKKHGVTNIRGKFTNPYETDGIIYKLTIHPKAPNVITETSEIQVLGTANATLPTVDGFSGQFWESTDITKATVVEGTGLVTGVAEGQCEIKGYFTTPYKVLAKKINLTIKPQAQPQMYNSMMWR